LELEDLANHKIKNKILKKKKKRKEKEKFGFKLPFNHKLISIIGIVEICTKYVIS
jgi:hypothetical protein